MRSEIRWVFSPVCMFLLCTRCPSKSKTYKVFAKKRREKTVSRSANPFDNMERYLGFTVYIPFHFYSSGFFFGGYIPFCAWCMCSVVKHSTTLFPICSSKEVWLCFISTWSSQLISFHLRFFRSTFLLCVLKFESAHHFSLSSHLEIHCSILKL